MYTSGLLPTTFVPTLDRRCTSCVSACASGTHKTMVAESNLQNVPLHVEVRGLSVIVVSNNGLYIGRYMYIFRVLT